jgi:hypothetical protein
MSDFPDPPTNTLAGAADRLRETARWFIAAFGAIGAVVVAGVTFSDIGKLVTHGSAARICFGLGGVVVAVGGLVVMLYQVVELATASDVSFHDMRTAETSPGSDASLEPAVAAVSQADNGVLTGSPSIDALAVDFLAAQAARHEALAILWTTPTVQTNIRAANDAAARLATLEADVDRVTSLGSLYRLRYAFRRSRGRIVLGFVAIVVGVVAFVAADQSPVSTTSPEASVGPIAVTLAPSAATRLLLVAQVHSPRCVRTRPSAIVLGVSDGKADVVIPGSRRCPPIRVVVPASEVIARRSRHR